MNTVFLIILYSVLLFECIRLIVENVIPYLRRLIAKKSQEIWERNMKKMDRIRRDNYGPYLDYLFMLHNQAGSAYVYHTFGIKVKVSLEDNLYRRMEMVYDNKILKIKYNQHENSTEQKVYEEEPGLLAEIMGAIKQLTWAQ